MARPKNPFEGLPIFEEGYSASIIPVVYESREAWERRHPGRNWDHEWWNYPDAVRYGPGGNIFPRIKNSAELTIKDLEEWGIGYHGWTILAKDRPLKDLEVNH